LELFQIQENNDIDIWVYISALPSEVDNQIVDKWIKDHLKEEGIEAKGFEIKVIMNMIESIAADPQRQIMIQLP